MAELSMLWNLLTPPPARTDWELLAHNLRLYALWPMVLEEIARQRITDIANFLRAQGLEPGTEEYAKEWEARVGSILQKYPQLEKRGITAQIPYRSTISIEEFQQKYPQQFQDVNKQVEQVVDSMASHLPEDHRNQIKSVALSMVMSGRVPVVVRPGGEVVVDQNSLSKTLADLGPRVYQVVQQTPVSVSILEWLKHPQGGNALDLADYLSSTPLGRMMAGMRGDFFRNAAPAVEAVTKLLSDRAQSVLSSVNSVLGVLQKYPSVELAENLKKQVGALQDMVRLGLIPESAISGITSTANSIMQQTVSVKILGDDGTIREVRMPLSDGLQVRAQQRQQIEKEVGDIANALAAVKAGLVPTDLSAQANMQRLNGVLKRAEALGVNVWPILVGAAVRARDTALDFAARQLAMDRARQQMKIDAARLGIDLERLELEKEGMRLNWAQFGLAQRRLALEEMDPNRVLARWKLGIMAELVDQLKKGGLAAVDPRLLDTLQVVMGYSPEALGRLDQRTYLASLSEFAKDIPNVWNNFTQRPSEATFRPVLGLFDRVSIFADPHKVNTDTARSTLSDFVAGLEQHVNVVRRTRGVQPSFRSALAAKIGEFATVYLKAGLLTKDQYNRLITLARTLTGPSIGP